VAEPIRYFLDQHVYGAVASGLRQHGIDVLTVAEAGRCGLPDAEQLAFATTEERVLVTFDPDFLALHNGGTAHGGIAWCPTTKYTIGPLLQLLVLLHGVSDRDQMRNRVEYL
jgi:hypothetical protein